jgi:signal transduction histidine kinase
VTNSLDVNLYLLENTTKELEFNQYLSTIISTVINFMHSPLTEMNGLCSLISTLGNLSQKQQEYLNKLQSTINIAELKIEELMSINRLNKKGFINISEISLDEIIKNAIEKYTPFTKQKRIALIKGFEKLNYKITSDDILLTHALLNVLDFSIKESQIGSSIEIDCKEKLGAIQISVQDHGKGMSKLDIDKILEDGEFDQPLSGLRITHNILKLLGGELILESNLGSGTKVTLNIPQLVY